MAEAEIGGLGQSWCKSGPTRHGNRNSVPLCVSRGVDNYSSSPLLVFAAVEPAHSRYTRVPLEQQTTVWCKSAL